MWQSLGSNVSTTPLRQWGFRQCLPFSWTTLRGKHCRHPIAVMGVVDTFELDPSLKHCFGRKFFREFSNTFYFVKQILYYKVKICLLIHELKNINIVEFYSEPKRYKNLRWALGMSNEYYPLIYLDLIFAIL